MTWVRVDNRFPEHPKLEQLAGEPTKWAKALALWMAASCYARRQQELHPDRMELHGFVPKAVLPRLVYFRDARKVADALATPPPGFEHGLLEDRGTAYYIHDFPEYGPPDMRRGAPAAAPVPHPSGDDRAEEVRRKRREAGKKGAQARWQSANGNGSDANGKSMANATDANGKVPPPSPPNNPPNPGYSESDPESSARESHGKSDGKSPGWADVFAAWAEGWEQETGGPAGSASTWKQEATQVLHTAQSAAGEGEGALDVVRAAASAMWSERWWVKRGQPPPQFDHFAKRFARYLAQARGGSAGEIQSEIERITTEMREAHQRHDHERVAELKARKAKLQERAS